MFADEFVIVCVSFNSRPHAEVDDAWVCTGVVLHLSTHDLTQRSTDFSPQSFFIVIFQLTTSRRGRHRMKSRRLRMRSFNSRPHAEVDRGNMRAGGIRCLSTHDLTQRSTFLPCAVPAPRFPFNSRPHAEVDFFFILAFCPTCSFNSRPHAEVDGMRSTYK